METIFLYITNPSKRIAKSIAKRLLKEKLIACANIFPIESSYWWQGKIESANEYVLICKTTKKNVQEIKKLLKKIHPYTVPCIAELDVRFNKEFSFWLESVLKKR